MPYGHGLLPPEMSMEGNVMSNNRCESCRFWGFLRETEPHVEIGECCRHARQEREQTGNALQSGDTSGT